MTNITNFGRIELNRGDSFKSPLFIDQGNIMETIRYELDQYDTIYFAIMEPNQSFENAILKKVYTYQDEKTEDGDIYIKLSTADTQKLLPGRYYYTIKFQKTILGSDPFVCTLIPDTEFFIMR